MSETVHTQTGGTAEHQDFGAPHEVREFSHGRAELIKVQGADIGRLVLKPGWHWAEHVRPIVGTEYCQAPHFQYHVSGRLHVQMVDGTEFEATAGMVTALPSGHDAWVVGDEDVVLVDWWGASNYAQP